VQQVEPASPGSSDTATADNQQEASPTQQPSHSASLAAAVMQPSSPAGRLDSGGAHALAQQQQQCLCSKLLCGGLHTSLGSNLALGLPLQQLQWALQDNSLFVEQLVSGCKGSVLSGVMLASLLHDTVPAQPQTCPDVLLQVAGSNSLTRNQAAGSIQATIRVLLPACA
jgi:hypothetical protein